MAGGGAGGVAAPWLDEWLEGDRQQVGAHSLMVLVARPDVREEFLARLGCVVQDHYMDPDHVAQRIEALGAPKTGALIRARLPRTTTAQSADLGEILATEIAEAYLGYRVPVRRLRWKDHPNMALRGTDAIGVRWNGGRVEFLKAEAKSRATASATVIAEAASDLEKDAGRPSRHSLLFVADRVRDGGDKSLAGLLELAVINSCHGNRVEHLLFILSGNNVADGLKTHLIGYRKRLRRHAVNMHIPDQPNFVERAFSEASIIHDHT